MGVYRRKSASEIEEEVAAIVAKGEIDIPPGTDPKNFLWTANFILIVFAK